MPSPDYLIITALPEEREGVERYLPGLRLVSDGRAEIPHVYYEAYLKSPALARIIVITIGQRGRVPAATVATAAINEWSPNVVLLVGVAGGRASKNVHLGDVLVATQIFDYEHQRVREGRAPEVHSSIWQADAKLHRAAVDRVTREWPGLIAARSPDGRTPSYQCGTVASGDKYVADGNFLASFDQEHPRLLGIEMEGSGVAHACQESNHRPRFLMIRAVSDLVDLTKRERNQVESSEHKAWRTYACHSAGLFAIDVIRSHQHSLGKPSAVGTQASSPEIRNTDACLPGLPPWRTTCCRCHDLTDDSYGRWPKLSRLVLSLATLCRTRAMSGIVAILLLLVAFVLRFLDKPPLSSTTQFVTLLGIALAMVGMSTGYTMAVARGLALKTQIAEGRASEDDVDRFLDIADGLAFLPDPLRRISRRRR